MAERPREWPLVIFTTALQCACGMALAALLLDGQAALSRPFALAICPVTIVGLLLSLFHVGRPHLAWRAGRQLMRSRLSREIVLTVAFAVAAALYAWKMTPGLGFVAALLGLGAVLSSARIYLIPSQPLWDSGWLPISFLATAMLLGGLAAWLAGERGRATVAMTVTTAAVLVFCAGWMMRRLARVRRQFDPVELPEFLAPRQYAGLAMHVALTGIVPVALVIGGGGTWPAAVALLATVMGAALGRTMVYSLSGRLPRF